MYKHLMVLLMLCVGMNSLAVRGSQAQSPDHLSEQHRILYWFTIGLGGTSIPETQEMIGGMMFRGVFAWDNTTISVKREGSSSAAPVSFNFFWTETGASM